MTSPYFEQGRSVVTRRWNPNAGRASAASLSSKLSNRPKDVDRVSSSAAVKVEEGEASIAGNVYMNPVQLRKCTKGRFNSILQHLQKACRFNTRGSSCNTVILW